MVKFHLIAVIVMVLGLWSCKQQSSYDQLVDRELAKGIRADSLFMGLHIGMIRQDFYDRCTELNKQQLITTGDGDLSVLHKLQGKKGEMYMHFFPNFVDNIIVEMPVEYRYSAWAPWNRNLWADSLLYEIKDMLAEKYGGNEFLEIRGNDPQAAPIFIKVDGNRRIVVKVKNEQRVAVTYTDLTHEAFVNEE